MAASPAASVARVLGRRGATIVSPENYMLYTPMLPEAASGTLEPRHVVVPAARHVPARRARARPGGRARRGGRGGSRCRRRRSSSGSRTTSSSITVGRGLADPADARPRRARPRLQGPRRRDRAAQPRPPPARGGDRGRDARPTAERELTFVFVGAGYAGVEALAELADLVRDALRFYPDLRHERQHWVLVDAAPKILPEIPRRLGEYAARELERRGVDIRVSTTLEELTGQTARLSDGETLLTHTVVWTAGVRASPAVALFGVPTDDRGRIVVGPTLQVEGRERVWALGDCARVPNEATPGHPDPPTCQHALRQARRLAKNLRGDPKPYRYRMLGQVATLGRGKGIADVLGLRLRGFPGWWVTRTYHLYQLPLFTRKLRVVVDWTVALFFRRDIAELGMLGRPKGLRD